MLDSARLFDFALIPCCHSLPNSFIVLIRRDFRHSIDFVTKPEHPTVIDNNLNPKINPNTVRDGHDDVVIVVFSISIYVLFFFVVGRSFTSRKKPMKLKTSMTNQDLKPFTPTTLLVAIIISSHLISSTRIPRRIEKSLSSHLINSRDVYDPTYSHAPTQKHERS